MRRYSVTFDLSASEFMDFLNEGRPLLQNIKITVHETAPDLPTEAPPTAAEQIHALVTPKTRKVRGSKVNEAVLDKLKGGNAHKKDLEAALTNAGFAPGSLSTSLASLQKNGVVKRLGDGVYALAEAA